MGIKLFRRSDNVQQNAHGQKMLPTTQPVSAQGPRSISALSFFTPKIPQANSQSYARLMSQLGMPSNIRRSVDPVGHYAKSPAISLLRPRPNSNLSGSRTSAHFMSPAGQPVNSARFASMVPQPRSPILVPAPANQHQPNPENTLPGPGFVAPSPF